MKYPRVLIVALARINSADVTNNGLLLRNLFGAWPKDILAQIYSSGNNGDKGFFGYYYQLGPRDRRLGRLFYRLKTEIQERASEIKEVASSGNTMMPITSLGAMGKRLLVDTGLYELFFRPRLSYEMLTWVEKFRPDLIFAQGYNLAFTWLPQMLARHFELPIAYYPTDDWPDDLYRFGKGRFLGLNYLARRAVIISSRQLVDTSIVRVAFNRLMQEEYLNRYGKKFATLMHGDNLSRFEAVLPRRSVPSNECWIVSTGVFNQHRRPLLDDLDQACEILTAKGLRIRTTVFDVNLASGMVSHTKGYRHVCFEPCPNHNGLASVLRGADILFLPERFDETAKHIRLSVSSKAHLFMFSRRPIIVYSDPVTGIARYAREEGWATVVVRRDPDLLATAIEQLITDESYRQQLVAAAQRTANTNHNLATIQSSFFRLLSSAL